VDNPKLTNQANPDALSPAPPASSPPEPLIRDRFLSGMNQVLTILRDLDCPLDVRVTMAHDVADAALRSMLASSPPEPHKEGCARRESMRGNDPLESCDCRSKQAPDPTCAHGTAFDVHCCACRRSGFFPPEDCDCFTDTATVDRIVQRVAELPNRTSPDEWPEAMLVTADELRQILADEWPASSPPEPPAERYRTHDDLDGTPRYRWETTEPSPPERSEGSPTLADYAQHRANCALQRWIDRGSVVPRPQCSCGLVGLLNRLALPPEPSNG
jgi:hypothetical protein